MSAPGQLTPPDPTLLHSSAWQKPQDVPPQAWKLVTATLLLLNLALRLMIAFRPLEYIDGVTIPDDAYLCLTLARSIAHGFGPLIGGVWTNGFQPLYVFLMVPVYMFPWHDPVPPVHLALVLLSVFDTLTLYLLLRLISRACRSPLSGGLVGVAWLSNPHGMAMTLSGMETAIACFFLVAVLTSVHTLGEGRTSGSWPSFALGVLLGGALWARVDHGILVLAVSIVLFSDVRRDLRARVQQLFLLLTGAMLTYAPWLVASYCWTGDLYPVSGKAIRLMALAEVQFQPTFENMYGVMMKIALQVTAIMNRGVLVAVVATGIALVVTRPKASPTGRLPLSLLATSWIYALGLYGIYIFYQFGHWFFDRYLFPVGIVLLLTWSLQMDALLARLATPRQRVRLSAVIAGLLLFGNMSDPRMHALLFSRETTVSGYRNLALWAVKTFPAGTVIGSSQSGALSYFADGLKVINLDGVVNRACYESLRDRTALDFIRREKIEYVIGWEANLRYIMDRSGMSTPDAFGPPRLVSGFRSWGREWYVMNVNRSAAP